MVKILDFKGQQRELLLFFMWFAPAPCVSTFHETSFHSIPKTQGSHDYYLSINPAEKDGISNATSLFMH